LLASLLPDVDAPYLFNTHTHARAHTHTHTRTHTHTHTHARTHTHTHIHTYTHTHIHTYTHTRLKRYFGTRQVAMQHSKLMLIRDSRTLRVIVSSCNLSSHHFETSEEVGGGVVDS
jgi:hypothetical protein